MLMYKDLSFDELTQLENEIKKQYEDFKSQNLKLDMSRGKPCLEQLELSKGMLDTINSKSSLISKDGIDCLNYGGVDGLKETKEFFSQLLDVPFANVIVGGNSSLTMMFDYISQCYLRGSGGKPWGKMDKVKFLCPVPGYDRHFAICEYFGIEMVNVPMLSTGPDMDIVEELVKDDAVKGMVCVPKYSNPTGVTYSDDTVKRLSAMETASDFRIIWDNAYCIHHLSSNHDSLLDLLGECKNAGNPDRAIMVASLSKVTFPGSGVAVLAASENNIKMIKERLSVQTIGPDKINQIRHTEFFDGIDNVHKHMEKHAQIIAPRFDVVLKAFNKELRPHGIASWEEPNGGYFISLDVLDGCAKRVYELCKDAGVTLTECGATYPYGKDPFDRNIRIAPTFPSVEELEKATQLLCVCVKLASIEKLKMI
ncbi:MAG: aminotransferase class I/II-fold pyridoxal phosphate-dependent enzyme [Clostridiales bacterium]|nr:aminotransferase class I/II-fold pyridoxal phosphate-dependent enzyme [Clostridiales bacterium]